MRRFSDCNTDEVVAVAVDDLLDRALHLLLHLVVHSVHLAAHPLQHEIVQLFAEQIGIPDRRRIAFERIVEIP